MVATPAENKKANLCGRGGMLLEKEIHKLEKEKQILLQLKEKIESMLNTAPEGGLVIRTKRGKPQYYWSRAGKTESYIKYNQIDFIKKTGTKILFRKSSEAYHKSITGNSVIFRILFSNIHR